MISATEQNDRKIYYTLRIAAAMCFIGHGAFGIITKQVWCNYFGVFGISQATAFKLMPWLGSFDVLIGLSILVYPMRIAVWWLVIWGTVTALLRPMSGEPVAEFFERAGNFGAPLALIILTGNNRNFLKQWFSPVKISGQVSAETLNKVANCLKIIVFLLLAGHGWLNLIEKKGLMGQYASLGFSNPSLVARVAGIFEIATAVTVLIRPLRSLIFILLIWKIGTELFYPHWELFEWIERGGSYGSLLALWLVLPRAPVRARNFLTAT